MFIIPTWVLVVGTVVVFLIALILGIFLGGVYLGIVAEKILNDSEYEVFDHCMDKIRGLENSRWTKEEP